MMPEEIKEFWRWYDRILEEEYREFRKGYPVLFNARTGKCFVPKRDYERNLDDPTYRRIKAEWIVKQIEEEGIETYHFEHDEWWKATVRKYRRRGVRYRSFPQPKGVIICVSEAGEYELPKDDELRTELVDNWLEQVPPNKRIGGNQDFGGKYRGLEPRGDGRFIRISTHIQKVRWIAAREKMLEWEAGNVLALKVEEWKTVEEREVALGKVEKWVRDQFGQDVR